MTKKETWERLKEIGVVDGDIPIVYWNLKKVNFSKANLIAVDLNNDHLEEANLSHANLTGANLTSAKLIKAYLDGANLREANLREANLRGANLRGANLTSAKLIKAYLGQADLSGVDFSEADLREADLSGANLSEADLRRANLRRANLGRANLSRANLRGANLRRAILFEADLSEANLNEAYLASSSLISSNLSKAILDGACIDDANLSGWNIEDIICTHLVTIKGGTKSVINFDQENKEFEKKYSQIHQIVEMILNTASIETASFIGNVISKSINHFEKSDVTKLKTVDKVSAREIKLTFICENIYYKKSRDDFEHLKKVLYQALKEMKIPFLPLKIKSEELGKKAQDIFIKRGKLADRIYAIVASIYK